MSNIFQVTAGDTLVSRSDGKTVKVERVSAGRAYVREVAKPHLSYWTTPHVSYWTK